MDINNDIDDDDVQKNALGDSTANVENLLDSGSNINEDGENMSLSENMKRDGLEDIHVKAYSVGHLFNDLCASCWFVYFVWYLKEVVKLDETTVAAAVLAGQLTDGISTPFIAALSDKFDSPCGKRTPWYIGGTFLVIPAFLGIFMYPPFINPKNDMGILITDEDTQRIKRIYYIMLPSIFNLGWSSVQLSNMSLVNSITRSSRKREQLNNNRNGFTSIASVIILTSALFLFEFIDDQVMQFRILGLIAVSVGFSSSLFYMVTIREVPLRNQAASYNKAYKIQEAKEQGRDLDDLQIDDNDERDSTAMQRKNSISQGKTWKDWLKLETFYIHMLVYMLVRIAVNVTMTIQPFYLQAVTEFKGTPDQPTPRVLALVPLISYIFQTSFSIFLQRKMTMWLRNRFLPMLFAIFIISAGFLPLAFLNGSDIRFLVYPLSILQGVGLIIMMNTATSLISDVIGDDAANAAFVYGFYSLADKIGNGALLFILVSQYTNDPDALRYILSTIPVICSVLAYCLTWIGNRFYANKLAKITGLAKK